MTLFGIFSVLIGIAVRVKASDNVDDEIEARISKLEAQLQTCMGLLDHQTDLGARVMALERQMKNPVHRDKETGSDDKTKTHSKYTSFTDKSGNILPNSRKTRTGNNRRSTLGNRHKRSVDTVAFTTKLSHELTNVPIGRTIVFDETITWTSDYYNNATGIFTSPVAGLYLFAIFVESSAGEAVITVRQDEGSYISAVSEPGRDGDDDTGGNIVLLPLVAGDMVWVETSTVDSQSLWPHYTTFSGVLIHKY